MIGAGPAGVQMGHLMHRAGLDYVLFERAQRAGAFFSKYPVHRRLNSYNRRHVRTAQPDFRLRHDWHTLLEQDELPRFANWTSDFFPLADTFVEYLNVFQQEQQKSGRLRYCHSVTAVRELSDGDAAAMAGRYELDISVASPCEEGTAWDGIRQFGVGETTVKHSCSVLVMADGMWAQVDPERDKRPWLVGTKNTVGYDELSLIPNEEFEDKRVLVVGLGNAAMETVDAMRDFASDIVLLGRGTLNRLASTRYVGHMRGPRHQTIDSSELKSLEGVVNNGDLRLRASGQKPVPPPAYAVLPCGSAKAFSGWPEEVMAVDKPATGFRGETPRCVFERHSTSSRVMLGWADEGQWQVKRAQELFGDALRLEEAPPYVQELYDTIMT